MLKSYEAMYQDGQLHWLGPPPPVEIERRPLLVVVDLDTSYQKPAVTIRQLLEQSRGRLKPLRSLDEIDAEAAAMRSEWER